MQRSDKMMQMISVILFLAMVAYMGSYLLRAVADGMVTSEAIAAEIDLSAGVNGLVLRRERVLSAEDAYAYVAVIAAEGEKVPAGAALALSVRSQEGLERMERMRELEEEIAGISDVLQRLRAAGDTAVRGLAVGEAAKELASAAALHDLRRLRPAALNLEALLVGAGAGVSVERLSALQLELERLRNSLKAESEELHAPVAGVFSALVDGYEHLGPGDLRDLTPSGLRRLSVEGKEPALGSYGKIVEDHRWYFAAVMDAGDAVYLSPGMTVALNFGRWYAEDIYVETVSVSAPEDGAVAVVFRCDTALAATLRLRSVNATVIFSSYSGVRVPAQAVQTDPETGQSYVWTVTALRLERREVEPLYTGEDYIILRRETRSGALREGETVVVSGRNLYEGKVVQRS